MKKLFISVLLVGFGVFVGYSPNLFTALTDIEATTAGSENRVMGKYK